MYRRWSLGIEAIAIGYRLSAIGYRSAGLPPAPTAEEGHNFAGHQDDPFDDYVRRQPMIRHPFSDYGELIADSR
jgi:hypothetical protein